MATNVSPDYIRAEEKYRSAQNDPDRLAALQEMLSTVPKHKASEKLQADLKTRISVLRKAVANKPAAKAGPVDLFHVPRGGAGQIVLVGAPNSGKSSLVGAVTSAQVKIAPYPYTTVTPLPGMWKWQDVQLQLVDTPPMTADHVPSGLMGTLRAADVLAIVVDASGELLEEAEAVIGILNQRGLEPATVPASALKEAAREQLDLPPLADDSAAEEEGGPQPPVRAVGDPARAAGRRTRVPAVIVAAKADAAAAGNIDTLREIYAGRLEVLPVSATVPAGFEELGAKLWELLSVIRIYTKEPGKPVDKERPYTLPQDSTIDDLCRLIHKDLPEKFKFARIWGEGRFSGQQVHLTEALRDKDTVEVHT